MRQSLLIVLACVSAQALAIEPARLTGVWRADKSAMIGHATAYMTFEPQGTCAQVLKGVIMGVDKWASFACTWTLDGEALTITATSASDQAVVGKTVRYKASLSPQDVLTLEADGNKQDSRRADAVPPEFAAHQVK